MPLRPHQSLEPVLVEEELKEKVGEVHGVGGVQVESI